MTDVVAAPSVSETIDARPIRRVSTEALWDHAITRRDEIAAQMRATLAAERIEALVFVSSNGVYPPWAKLEAWLPELGKGGRDESRERSGLLVVVDVKPYHAHPIVVNAAAQRGARKIVVEGKPQFSPSDAAEWTRYALHRGGKPSRYRPLADALREFAASLPLVPVQSANPIAKPYRSGVNGTGLTTLASVIVIALGLILGAAEEIATGTALVLVGAAGLAMAIALERRRARAVFVIEQPDAPPRNLGLVDSWHAVVARLGPDYEAVKARLFASVTAERAAGLSCRSESYGYRLPNGFEERERLVVVKNQSLVHVHVYRFGDDVFVGWQAYLNWAQWGETTPVSSRTEGAQVVDFVDLREAYYIPNQLDLMDLNSLGELVHRRLEIELKAILKEKEIDQEIDFGVIRGDRGAALDKARHDDPTKGRRGWRYVSTESS